MAQKLKDTDSVDRCRSMARRSSRMLAQNKKADDLIASVKTPIDACKAKQSELETAQETADDRFDEWCFQDGNLDDEVRNTGEDCTKYDRMNPGSMLFSVLFPNGISEVIRENRSVEPDVVNKIAAKIEQLGTTHPLYARAATLREQASLTKEKEKLYNDECAAVDKISAELEMLKLDLIKKYNDNILEATKRFGESYTNRLFPKIRDNGKTVEAVVVTKAVPVTA